MKLGRILAAGIATEPIEEAAPKKNAPVMR